MDIEEYAAYTHFYSEQVPALLSDLLAPSRAASTFIDIGCGDGGLLFALKTQGLLEGKTVHAVDLSKQRIELVKKLDSRFHCVVSDASSIPSIQDGSCDVVASTQVIEHVENELKMLQEISRILKKDGKIFLSTVFKRWYGWYFYRCGGNWVLDPTHLREYTRDSQLLDLIEAAGLKVVVEKKTLFRFPLIDFALRRLSVSGQRILKNRFLTQVRKLIQVPIPGYYNWEMILTKR